MEQTELKLNVCVVWVFFVLRVACCVVCMVRCCLWCCGAAVCRVRAAWSAARGAVYDVLLFVIYNSFLFFHCCSFLLNALENLTEMCRNKWKRRMIRNHISKTADRNDFQQRPFVSPCFHPPCWRLYGHLEQLRRMSWSSRHDRAGYRCLRSDHTVVTQWSHSGLSRRVSHCSL